MKIYCRLLKTGEFANAEDGSFASYPNPGCYWKTEPERIGCEEAPSAKHSSRFHVEPVYTGDVSIGYRILVLTRPFLIHQTGALFEQ